MSDDSLGELAIKIKEISNLYSSRFNINRDKDWYILKLQEEIGELSKLYNVYSGRARPSNDDLQSIKAKLAQELADVLAHTILLADSLEIEIASALHEKWLIHLGN
jgi:NTP pyrophosphatase (non-canonical NTP hydrolase)